MVKKFEKSNELFDAALNEFGEKGYQKASLNKILKIAGISKGTFYYHFKNKEDIYEYLLNILLRKKKEFFTSRISEDLFQRDFFEILEALIHYGLEFAKQNPLINKFSEHFLKDRNNHTIQRILSKMNTEVESSNFLDVYIEMAYNKNEIREDISKDFIKKIVSYLFVHMTDFTEVNKVEDVKLISDYLIKFIKNGISKS